MTARICDISGLAILGILALAGFLIPVIIGAVKGDSRVRRGIEAAILALIGGVSAPGFISLVRWRRTVGRLGLFPVPDCRHHIRTKVTYYPDILITFASIVSRGNGIG